MGMGAASGVTQQGQQAPGGKGAGQPTQSPPGGKGAGQPSNVAPGQKGAGQPMQPPPGGKGAGQPTPGGKSGMASPYNSGNPMGGQAPGGKGGMGQPLNTGGPQQGGMFGGQQMPQQGGMMGNQMNPKYQAYMQSLQGTPAGQQGGMGGMAQPATPDYAAMARANPHINPAEITDLQGMQPGSPAYVQRLSELRNQGFGQQLAPAQAPGGKGKGAPQSAAQAQAMQGQAPGGKSGQMDSRLMASLQAQQANQMSQQQPAHQAFGDQFNVQQGQRGSVPFSPPGTNGSPQAYGHNPNVGGFGFGNGATQVPQIQNPMVGRTPQPNQNSIMGSNLRNRR